MRTAYLKKLAHRLFNSMGLEVTRYVPPCGRQFDVLELLVRDRLASEQAFFFVQIGANDGVLDDTLRPLIIRYRLHGLLVEPMPDVFARLRENYSDQRQLRFANVAITERTGRAVLFRAKTDAPVPDWAHGSASFDRRHLTNRFPACYIEELSVEAVTLSELLSRHDVRDITLLQVDAEGDDYRIVKSAIDLGIRPRIVRYEHIHLPAASRWQCRHMLATNGYGFLDIGNDTIAILNQNPRELSKEGSSYPL